MPDLLLREIAKHRRIALASEIEHPLRRLPQHLRPSLAAYLLDREPVGAFLRAILVNDLQGTVSRADDRSYLALRDIVAFVHTHAPSGSHGSYAAYISWTQGERI